MNESFLNLVLDKGISIMGKTQMSDFVENLTAKGLSREEAIRNLAFVLDREVPTNQAELWFQQMIGGE